MGGTDLARKSSSDLARQGGTSLVEFEPDVRALLAELAPGDGGMNLSPDIIGAIEEITKYLTPFLPWLAVPAALIPGLKNWLARGRFKKLLGQILIHVLRPDTPLAELNDIRTVVRLGKLVDLGVTVELAEEVLGLVPLLLRHASVQGLFQSRDLERYLAFVERRVRVARGDQPDSNDQLVQIAVTNALSTVLQIAASGAPKQLGPLLEAIAAVSAAHLDEARSTVDVNVMVVVADKQAALAECIKNTDAHKAFGAQLYERAEVILRVRATTNATYDGFWLPVFTEVSAKMPGASTAFRTKTPQLVFTRHVGEHLFGTKHAPEDVKRIISYLSEVPFKVFLSFPVLRDGHAIAVVNVNITDDEIKLYNRAELHRLYHTLKPFLTVVEITLG